MMKRNLMNKKAAAWMMTVILAMSMAAGTTSFAEETTAEEESLETSEKETDAGEESKETEETSSGTVYKGEFEASDESIDWESAEYTTITCTGETASCDNEDVKIEGSDIKIKAGGTYVLTGELTDGSVTVNADNEDEVILVLNGVTIRNEDGPAVIIKDCAKTVIVLADGTENTAADGSAYADDSEDAAVYSKSDLVFTGNGSLLIQGNMEDAVHGKDEIRILGGNIEIESADDGIVAKEGMAIRGGTLTLNTTADGLKSKTSLWIGGGSITVNAGDDGIHADEALTVDDGTIDVQNSNEGLEAPELVLNGGDISVVASDDGINAAGGELTTGTGTQGNSDAAAPSGELSDENMPVPDETADGEFPAPSGDFTQMSVPGQDSDRMQAGGPMQNGEMPQMGGRGKNGGFGGPNGGMEGFGGDQMNGEAGNFGGQMMGGGMMEKSSGSLYINGGTIYVNAGGDGIDANTGIVQTGGDVVVDGPTDSGNGGLDYTNSYVMTGGSLIVTASSGMLQSISENSESAALNVVFTGMQSAGSEYVLKDSNGEIIFTHTAAKEHQALILAGGDLAEGETYTLYADGSELFQTTLTGTVTTVNESGENTQAGNFGGFGGFGRR